MRIQPVPFGLAFGIVYAVVFFLYGILAALLAGAPRSPKCSAASIPALRRRRAAR